MAKEKTNKYYGTGHRKTSVAKVTLTPGTGKITVNGRDVHEYFPSELCVMDLSQPLELTNTTKSLITDGPVDISGTLSASDMSINNRCNISSTGTITSSTYPLSTINKLNDTPQINKTTINGALISLTTSVATIREFLASTAVCML